MVQASSHRTWEGEAEKEVQRKSGQHETVSKKNGKKIYKWLIQDEFFGEKLHSLLIYYER